MSSLQILSTSNLVSQIQALPPQLQEDLIGTTTQEIWRIAEAQACRTAHDVALDTMRRIYSDIAEDLIYSRSFGDERMDYDDVYPDVDKRFLYALINMIEGIIDKVSVQRTDTYSSGSYSCSDSP